MLSYFRFTMMPFVYTPMMIVLLLNGGHSALYLPLSVIILQILFDNLLPKYTKAPKYENAFFLDFLVFIQVPLSFLAIFVLAWQVSPGDAFGFGAWFEATTGIKVLENHHQMTFIDSMLSAMACGFYFSVSTLIGHELTHRIDKPFSMFMGKLILALVGDTQFAISHVHAHHKNVATPLDAATARRGENLYAFFVRSSLGQYRESWEFEVQRLKRLKKFRYSFSNDVLSGLALTAVFASVFFLMGGAKALLCYLVFIFVAKFLFECVNYIEHYGLVRVPNTKVMPRHSWDCRNVMSTFNYLNLTRHSDHHANARKPYWDLETQESAMDLAHGYMFYILLATFPPLWHKLMIPRLIEWDNHFATVAEKELAKKENIRSGINKLIAADTGRVVET